MESHVQALHELGTPLLIVPFLSVTGFLTSPCRAWLNGTLSLLDVCCPHVDRDPRPKALIRIFPSIVGQVQCGFTKSLGCSFLAQHLQEEHLPLLRFIHATVLHPGIPCILFICLQAPTFLLSGSRSSHDLPRVVGTAANVGADHYQDAREAQRNRGNSKDG